MRWTLVRRTTNGGAGGRRSRSVLTPRRWCQLATMLAHCAGTEAIKPGLRGDYEGNRKTVAAGNAGMIRCDRSDLSSCALLNDAREAVGANGARAFPAPSSYGGQSFAEPGREERAAGMRNRVIARSNATKQSSMLIKSGLLRGACHRARIRGTRWLAMTATGCLTKIGSKSLARSRHVGGRLSPPLWGRAGEGGSHEHRPRVYPPP
jgi:hypothetical protein